MSTLQTLLDAGAEIVCGTVNLDRVEMGRLRDGDLHLTAAGREKLGELAEADTPDTPAKPAKPAAKKPAAKKPAAKDVSEDPVADAMAMVDDLNLDNLD